MLTLKPIIIVPNLIVFGGWDCLFYIFGFIGILWFPMFMYYCYETPSKHPTITSDELLYINQGKSEPVVVTGNTPLLSDSDGNNYPITSSSSHHQEGPALYSNLELKSDELSTPRVTLVTNNSNNNTGKQSIWKEIKCVPWKHILTNMTTITLYIQAW